MQADPGTGRVIMMIKELAREYGQREATLECWESTSVEQSYP